MQLESLLEKLKMEHLGTQLESVCEQAAKRELAYKEFLAEALSVEWNGRHLKGGRGASSTGTIPRGQDDRAVRFRLPAKYRS